MTAQDLVAPFLESAAFAGGVLRDPAIGRAWHRPSALALTDVGTLAGHLFLVLRRVDKHLDEPPPVSAPAAEPVAYRPIRVERPEDLELEVHRQVRADGAHVAAWGWEDVVAAYAERLGKVERRLGGALPSTVDLGGRAVPFDGYLASRVTELLVHADDLAVSAGAPLGEPPAAAMDVALRFVLDLGRQVHGDLAVLRSFTRRERVGPSVPAVY